MELARALSEGYRACMLFIIQRNDAQVFSPNVETDPKFGKAPRRVATKRVEVYAYSAEFTENVIMLGSTVPLRL